MQSTNDEIVEIVENTHVIHIDWKKYFSDEEENNTVTKALIEMDFECLIGLFKEHKIDYEAFYLMNTQHIMKILEGFPTGFVIKFENIYRAWIEKNPNRIQSQLASEKTSQEFIITRGFVKSTLESTIEGKEFLRQAKDSDSFSKHANMKLANILLSSIISQNLKLSKRDFELLSHDIENTFPKEKASTYFDVSTGRGFLYDKYYYKLRVLRDSKTPAVTKMKKEVPIAGTSVESFPSDEIHSDEFVQHASANNDYASIATHWKISSKLRLHKFRTVRVDSTLVSLYKPLERPDGHMLIQLDFQTLFPNNNEFESTWNLHQKELIRILERDCKNGTFQEMIKNSSSFTQNQLNACILFGLHAYLYSTTAKFSNKETKYRATVADSIKFFIFTCKTENSVDLEMRKWKELIAKNKMKQQATIIAFGDNLTTIADKIIVEFENIRYNFEGKFSLVYAMQCLIQIYHVFDIHYPELNHNVYQFIFQKFFSTEVPLNKKSKSSNKVNELLNSFTFAIDENDD